MKGKRAMNTYWKTPEQKVNRGVEEVTSQTAPTSRLVSLYLRKGALGS